MYIGKLVQPKKPITDRSDDNSHTDYNAAPVIQFGYANSEHKFVVDKILSQGQGVTFDLLNDAPPEAIEEVVPDLDEDGNPIPIAPKEPTEPMPKFMIIPEVVKESRMHFFRVPKLGSYMAIRLEYESCLFEEALDAGVTDQINVNERLRV